MSSSKLLGPTTTAAAAAAAYVVVDTYRVPSDADHPIIYPVRRAARLLTTRRHSNRRHDRTLSMIESKECNLGKVLHSFVTRNKYPSGQWVGVDAPPKMPESNALCTAIEKDTNNRRRVVRILASPQQTHGPGASGVQTGRGRPVWRW